MLKTGSAQRVSGELGDVRHHGSGLLGQVGCPVMRQSWHTGTMQLKDYQRNSSPGCLEQWATFVTWVGPRLSTWKIKAGDKTFYSTTCQRNDRMKPGMTVVKEQCVQWLKTNWCWHTDRSCPLYGVIAHHLQRQRFYSEKRIQSQTTGHRHWNNYKQEQLNTTINSSSSKDSSKFWGVMRNLLRKTHPVADITITRWQNHFESLLNMTGKWSRKWWPRE